MFNLSKRKKYQPLEIFESPNISNSLKTYHYFAHNNVRNELVVFVFLSYYAFY